MSVKIIRPIRRIGSRGNNFVKNASHRCVQKCIASSSSSYYYFTENTISFICRIRQHSDAKLIGINVSLQLGMEESTIGSRPSLQQQQQHQQQQQQHQQQQQQQQQVMFERTSFKTYCESTSLHGWQYIYRYQTFLILLF